MKVSLVLCILHFAALFSMSAAAQDLFSNAGQTERSYNYVEGFYLVNLDSDLPDGAEVNLPVLLRLSLDLNPRYSIRGEFLNQSYEIALGNGRIAEFDVGVYSLGVRYRDTLTGWTNTDWLLGVLYSRVNLDITDGIQSVSGQGDFYGVYAGLRRTIADKLEGEAGIDFSKPKDGGSISGTGEAALVYRVAPHLDVALGFTSITDGNNYGFGLRYTWF